MLWASLELPVTTNPDNRECRHSNPIARMELKRRVISSQGQLRTEQPLRLRGTMPDPSTPHPEMAVR